MDRKKVLDLFDGINIWKNGSKRAPHKPLLILLAISKLINEKKEQVSYAEIETPLKNLLEEFGTNSKNQRPHYPYWRLKNDSVWEIFNLELLENQNKEDQSPKELREKGISAGFNNDIIPSLKDSSTRVQIISRVLYNHFPESLHADILTSVGLSTGNIISNKIPRDPKFRPEVLNAYGYKCAICEFDLRIENSSVGLEAAHIQWVSALGPDSINNGICLCTLHHMLFDRGVFTVDHDFKILISSRVHGNISFNETLLKYHSKKIKLPKSSSQFPSIDYLKWNKKEVFRSPSLDS